MARAPIEQRRAAIAISTRYGDLHALSNDKPIVDALIRYGEWAQIEIEFVSQFLAGCEQILDIGSHVGVHATAFARLSPKATVIAFEPQPDLYAQLQKNVSAYSGRIQPKAMAIGLSDGVAFIPQLPDGKPINAGASALASEPAGNNVEVQVRALDSLPFETVGFIKLDVEGCEADAINGATTLISRCRPVIYAEVNTVRNGGLILEAANALDYDAYFVATPAFNPHNHRGSDDNMFGFANETAFVLLPKGRPAPDPMRTSLLRIVRTVDEFAAAFLSVPRYGDATAYDRNASELGKQLAELRTELESAHNRSRHVAAELATTQAKLAHAGELERALQAEQQKNTELQVENKQMRSDHSAAKESLELVSNQNKDLRRAVALARAEATKAQGLLVETQLRVAALAAEVEAARRECLKLADKVADSANERDAQASRIVALEHNLSEQTAALDGALSRVEAAERRFEAQRTTLGEQREQATKFRSGLVAEQKAHERTQARIEAEQARRKVVLELLGPGDILSARKGSFGSLARRYLRGKMADAVRDIEDSGLFDEAWYAETYPDAVKDLHPIAHYLLHGGYDGFNPGPTFDSNGYLAANPDVWISGMNPLLHYLHWGRREGRRWSIVPQVAQPATPTAPTLLWSRPKAPAMGFFRRLSEQHAAVTKGTPLVDVIVPVYRSYDDTLACLASVLTSQNETPFELIVIDDCSPEPEVSAALEELAQLGLITLVRNERNLGFVGTVNRGMALHADRDALLLNSDTLVFNDWLDRLRAHALQDRVATITPFTNNGTICSYPKFCRDNKEAFDRPFDEVDRLFGAVNAKRSIEIPTGVGFCIYITRTALAEMGAFDEETFGKGYGEENDFCMRASKSGWRNLHALDVFVFHSGETSFAETAQESKRRGLALLQEKHPEYDAAVNAYIGSDPSRAARIAADIAQLLGRAPAQATLCFSHTSGGGIGRYLADYSKRHAESGRDTVLFVPSVSGTCTGRLTIAGARTAPANLDGIDLVRDADTLRTALALLHVDHVEIHSTVGWSYKIAAVIERLTQLCSINYSVMLHDYVTVCPQINLINESGKYCGEEGIPQCHRCVTVMKEQPRAIHPDIADPAQLNVVAWRKMYGRLLDHAVAVAAPSRDTANRIKRYFGDLEVSIAPHAEDLSHIPKLTRFIVPGQRIRVGVIGAIGPHKGSRVLLNCARDAARRNLPLEFVVIGYTDIDGELQEAQVTVTGRYNEDAVADLLTEQGVHIAFLPSVWPETFCYTLSVALAGEIPVCVFDLGAQAERVAQLPRSRLLKIANAEDAEYINGELLQFSESLVEESV